MRKTHRSLPTKNPKTYGKLKVFILLVLVVGGISGFAGWEMQTSRLQAMFFSEIAKTFSFEVKPNESKDIRFPVQGPYDIRLGYVRIQEWTDQLKNKGFIISDQARWSYELEHCADLGLSPVYVEKNQAGIRILDKNDQEIIDTAFPQRIYTSFESIPPIAVNLLLFIENRKLLDATTPFRNPAIEWERLGKAVIDAGINVFVPGHRVPGGSTLATQMEKFRHSPEGITDSAEEKLRQLLSASLRAYLHGQKTETVRKQIVLDYINSIPLSAAAGFGEVNGMGDGLWAWYGMDFAKPMLGESPDPEFLAEHQRSISPLLVQRKRFTNAQKMAIFDLQNEDQTNEDVYIFSLISDNQKSLVIFNNSNRQSVGKVIRGWRQPPEKDQSSEISLIHGLCLNDAEQILFSEIRTGETRIFQQMDLATEGLDMVLLPYQSLVFSVD